MAESSRADQIKTSELAYLEWKQVDTLVVDLSIMGRKHPIELKTWRALLPSPVGEGIGIDPGRNFGIGVVREDTITIYGGRLPTRTTPSNFLSMIDAFMLTKHFDSVRGMPMVVEGAAHAAEVGQVLLAEIRAGFFIGMMYFNDCESQTVAPTKIRKQVFGSGKDKAYYHWPLVNPNAADAGACALYAAGYKFKEIEIDGE